MIAPVPVHCFSITLTWRPSLFIFQTLVTTLDKICVQIDNDNILRSRCEAKQTFDRRFHTKDTGVIDCDAYIPEPEGSGVDEDLGTSAILFPVIIHLTSSQRNLHRSFSGLKFRT